ncbi:kynurenine formamidase-like [Penaeus chinensis]|uniref:kynurenine formamidase-like n=1 Tax=Penaeus chinensis TaxID=139456 RepID=UPI001FB829E8|nr:kynurenine formamidase-like [Penaeus chinensis]
MASASHEPQKEDWTNMDKKELEAQYSPSRWSRRYAADEIIGAHVREAALLSKAARADLPRPPRLDVPYGSAPRAKLDVYGEDLPGDSPVMVYVHGGYWQELNKDLSAYPVKPLYSAGIVAVIVGYDLAPQVSVEVIVEEVRAAVAWACTLAQGRGSECVVLSGWSAGAHLVTQVLSTWPTAKSEKTAFSDPDLTSYALDLVKGVVTFSGVFDLRPLVGTYVNDPLRLTESSAWTLSPLRVVGDLSKTWPHLRLLVTAGQHDSPEFKRQSLHYSQVCGVSGLQAEYVEVEADHFSIVEELSREDFSLTQRVLAFFRKCRQKEEMKKV